MKTIDVSTWVRNFAVIVCLLAVALAGWTAHENHTLIATNAELARWVTEKVEGFEHELSALRRSDAEVMQALRTSGSRVADSLLLRRVER